MNQDNSLEQAVQTLEQQWEEEKQVKKCSECVARYQHLTERPCRDCKPIGKGEMTNG